jgi:H+-transporting ATPase
VDPVNSLSSPKVDELRRTYGWNEVEQKKPSKLLKFAGKFWGPSSWMIEIIAVLSAFLNRIEDVLIACGLLIANAVIGFLHESKAERAVELLRQKLQVIAKVCRDGEWKQVPARELVPGDTVRIRLGDFVAADVQIQEGEVLVDQSMLTGESGDIRKGAGEITYSGSLVRRGEATCTVTGTGSKTYYGRTIELLESARPRLHIEEIVGKLVRWLFVAVGSIVVIATVESVTRGMPLAEILPLSLVLLMSAVPVALPVMFTVSTSVAAHELGERGVLVTRLSAAEDAATMDTLCVDKTGTITENKLSVINVIPNPGVDSSELLAYAALSSDIADNDSIDLAVLKFYESRPQTFKGKRLNYVPFSPETRRTEAELELDGKRITVTKGAVDEVASWTRLPAEEKSAVQANAIEQAKRGYKTIGVARSISDQAREFLGVISLEDSPRADSKSLIDRLHGYGVRVKMLTGDALPVAQEIAHQVGLGEIVALDPVNKDAFKMDWNRYDGVAQVYPETKFRLIKSLQKEGRVAGMTGDGVNDAPSLKRAEVGIAVRNATDAAKSAASVVLMTEGLSGIVDLVENGRAVYQRLLTWFVNKISRTVLKSGFVVLAYFVFGKFVISALAMLLLVFMTDFAKISLSTDHVRVSPTPDTWNIRPLAMVGVILGLLMIGEAMLLLWIGVKLNGLSIETKQLYTFTFLTFLFMAVFSVFSIRERRHFWSSAPSRWLLAALGADATVGMLIGLIGFTGLPRLNPSSIALVFFFSAAFNLVLNDFVKYGLLKRFLL